MKGSCLCRKICYEITGEILGINYCHCKKCQKASGSAFATSAAVNAKEFSIVSGQENLHSFQSSKDKNRYFCNNCGSPIYSHRKNASTLYIRLGTLNDDPIKRPQVHIFTNEKPCWHNITDQIPQLTKDEGLWF